MRIYFSFLIFFIVIIIILFSSASSSSFHIFLYLFISLIKLYGKDSLKWGNSATDCINQPLDLWIWRKYDTTYMYLLRKYCWLSYRGRCCNAVAVIVMAETETETKTEPGCSASHSLLFHFLLLYYCFKLWIIFSSRY